MPHDSASPLQRYRLQSSPGKIDGFDGLAPQVLEGLLAAARLREACPPAERLLQHDAHLLPEQERADIDLHLGSCEACREDLMALQVPLEPDFGMASPLDALLQAGRRLVRAILEPLEASPAIAFRGDTHATHLRYRVVDQELLLAVTPGPSPDGAFELEGQLEPFRQEPVGPGEAASPCPVRLLSVDGGGISRQDAVDALGFFVLERIPRGRYRLEIDLPEIAVIVEVLDIS